MTTTKYILELFIAGIFCSVWMGLLAVLILGRHATELLDRVIDADLLLLALVSAPFIYTLGVISDRVVDHVVTGSKDDPARVRNRSVIYLKVPAMMTIVEYNKLRIRICRNWMAHGPLIGIVGLIVLWVSPAVDASIELTLRASLLLVLLIGGSVAAARFGHQQLLKKEATYLKEQAKLVREMED